jgi:hypothetical protein
MPYMLKAVEYLMRGLDPDPLRGRGKLIGGDLDVDDKGSE